MLIEFHEKNCRWSLGIKSYVKSRANNQRSHVHHNLNNIKHTDTQHTYAWSMIVWNDMCDAVHCNAIRSVRVWHSRRHIKYVIIYKQHCRALTCSVFLIFRFQRTIFNFSRPFDDQVYNIHFQPKTKNW